MKLPKNEEQLEEILPKETNYLTIIILSGPDTIEKFKVKKNESLVEVMLSVSLDIGKSLGSLRFVYNAGILNKDDTPSSRGLKDDEEIFVFVEHPMDIYEYINELLLEEIKKRKSNYINFKIRDDSDVVPFKIRKDQPLRKVIRCFCKDVGCPLITMKFFFKSKRVHSTATPDEIGLKDGDTIDAFCHLYWFFC